MIPSRSLLRGVILVPLLTVILTASAGAQDDVATRAAASRLKAGDRIVLNFLRDRELNDSIVVTERGEGSFPKLGVLRVSDLTISQLQDTLLTRYKEYFRLPELQIAVLRRVSVNGEVRMPNAMLVEGTSTVREVIARAGGITNEGDRKKVSIIRGGRSIPAKNWDRSESIELDLQSGDQVLVGRKSWLVLNALSVISTAVLVTSFVISLARK